jgi:hypothetical protein
VYTSGVHKELSSTSRGQDFLHVLADSGADIILNGHDHHYERIKNSGPREFIVGTGGMNTRPSSEPYAVGSEKIIDNSFGYLYLELFPGRYQWAFKNVSGDILDKGSDICSINQ